MYKHWLKQKVAVLHQCYHKHFGVRPLSVSQADISAWFTTALGQRLLAEEQQYIDALLSEMFGYHLMSMSVLPQSSLIKASPTSYQFSVSPIMDMSGNDIDEPIAAMGSDKKRKRKTSIVQANFEDLPIESQSIDVALLHHVLDFSSNPHQLLREVTRTLMPNGHIVLVGFNPWSALGLRRALSCVISSSHFYRQHHLQVSRLNDWCKVLELELVYSDKGHYGLPFDRCGSSSVERMVTTLGKNIYPYFGGFYVLVLRKNVTPVRMIKSSWKKRKVLPKWKRGLATSVSSSSVSSTHAIDRDNK
jgi:SAM-dependent methyltransferase